MGRVHRYKTAWHTFIGVCDTLWSFGSALVQQTHGGWICFLGGLSTSFWGNLHVSSSGDGRPDVIDSQGGTLKGASLCFAAALGSNVLCGFWFFSFWILFSTQVEKHRHTHTYKLVFGIHTAKVFVYSIQKSMSNQNNQKSKSSPSPLSTITTIPLHKQKERLAVVHSFFLQISTQILDRLDLQNNE